MRHNKKRTKKTRQTNRQPVIKARDALASSRTDLTDVQDKRAKVASVMIVHRDRKAKAASEAIVRHDAPVQDQKARVVSAAIDPTDHQDNSDDQNPNSIARATRFCQLRARQETLRVTEVLAVTGVVAVETPRATDQPVVTEVAVVETPVRAENMTVTQEAKKRK